jgi:hypothetical protein
VAYMTFQLSQSIKNIQAKPRWLSILLVLSVVAVLIEILMHSYLVESVLQHLPPSATAQDKLLVAQALKQELIVRAAFLPIRLLIGWTFFALLLYSICRFLIPQNIFRFIQIFVLEIRAEFILMLARVATLIGFIVNSSAINSRITVPFSLAYFFPATDYSIFAFLNSINIFSIMYITFLTVGISVLCNVTKRKALFIVIVVWGVSVLFNIVLLTVFRDRLHLLIN